MHAERRNSASTPPIAARIDRCVRSRSCEVASDKSHVRRENVHEMLAIASEREYKAHSSCVARSRWSNKQRSTTKLNPHSPSSVSSVDTSGRPTDKTTVSCGPAPSRISPSQQSYCRVARRSPSLASAGRVPASLARAVPFFAARGAEFISVSGHRTDRSALVSDLRLKRTSGLVAATELPHAPMNSPDAAGSALLRV